MPLYQLLGGAIRRQPARLTGMPAAGPPELFDRSSSTWTRAYRAIRVQMASRDWPSVYGVASSRQRRRRHRSGHRQPLRLRAGPPKRPAGAETWDTRAICAHVRLCSRRCATNSAPSCPLLHDGIPHDPDQAARLGRAWNPTPVVAGGLHPSGEPGGAAAGASAHDDAAGRSGRSSTRCGTTQTLIREQLIDYVRSAVTHTGGIRI